MDAFTINGVYVPPGKNQMINFNIARLPSGTQIDLPIYVYRGEKLGPTLLLLGGLHGDEVNGIEVVRRLIVSEELSKIQVGNIIAVPILNIYGFLNFSRDVPDGKDINRNFPGSTTGSLAGRVAHFITTNILPLADYGIDFHTGGASRHNHPQTRYAGIDPRAKALCEIFNAPVTLQSPLIDKSLRKQAYKMGVPLIVFEGGESLRIDEESVNQAIFGVKRVITSLGMAKFKLHKPEYQPVHCGTSQWVRAKSSGIVNLHVSSGEVIEKGQLIATITDPFGQFKVKVKAPFKGFVIGHNNMPVISQGDALFHVGKQD